MAPEAMANSKALQPHPGFALFLWLAVAATGLLAMLLTLAAPQFLSGTIAPGEMVNSDIVAVHPATIEDKEATRQAREKAKQSVLPVLERDHTIDQRIANRLQAQLTQVGWLRDTGGLPLPSLTAEEQAYLIESSPAVWQRVRSACLPEHQQPTGEHPGNLSKEAVRPRLEESIVNKLQQSEAGACSGGASRRSAASKHKSFEPLSAIEKVRHLYSGSGLSGHHDLLYLAVSEADQSWTATKSVIEATTRKLLKLEPLFPDTPKGDWERTALEFLPDSWGYKLRWTASRVIASALEPNIVVDAEATKVKAESAAALIKPVMKCIKPGQVIAAKGSIVAKEMSDTLSKLGVTRRLDWALILSLVFSLIASSAFFGLFLHTYAPKHLFSPASLGLLFTVSVVTCGVAAFIGQTFPQFVPLPAAALVATVFFGPRVAAALVFMIVVFLQVDNLVNINNVIALLAASTVALGANVKQRHELIVRGFLIGIVQSLGFLCASFLTHSLTGTAVVQNLLLQTLGGISSCIVAIGSLPFLEDIFGMVTPLTITELTASDQPLLRQLEEAAPGTYQHSLAVANLAEAGARAIGADVTLVRAGSLYHDIGKMVRPPYFIENQLGAINPHDSMTPEESRDRVMAHVSDGLSLARKFGLPRVVQDFIPQHQGTTLMAYFFHKACLRDGIENVAADFYRYPGPKPQSREASIVMLADVSEAVTHSLDDPTQEEVEESIGSVFSARWDDGQFTESGITKEELERVKKAFARVWKTLHHERLKYPATSTGRMPVFPEPHFSAVKLNQTKQEE